MTTQGMAEQADRERAERDRKLNDDALKAQRDRDAKTEEYMGADEYVVIAPYVTLKVKGRDGGPTVINGFNEGAVVKGEDIDRDNLRHHVETRLMVPKGAPEAEFAGPAGTPKPGEPPNVPVEEGTPVEMLPTEERIARQRKAADEAQENQKSSTSRTSRQSAAARDSSS